MGESRSQVPHGGIRQVEMVVGMLSPPGMTSNLAQKLARDLPGRLRARFPDFTWRVELATEVLAGPAGSGEDLVQLTRRRLLNEGWRIAVCLTDLPLHVGRRPVTGHVSVSLAVGLVSVPALGVVGVEQHLQQTVLRIVEGLLGERVAEVDDASQDRERHARMRKRLQELASPIGRADVRERGTFRFVTAVTRGNMRLLAGMVRTNEPWRLVAGLSRASVAALGTAAFAITSPGIWRIADGIGVLRLVLLTIGSVLAISLSLILVHRLWERVPRSANQPEVRERVVLFNLATVLTVAIGVLTLYLAQFLIVLFVGLVLITPSVLRAELEHAVGLADYLLLSWLSASLAVVGGALGAALENDAVVREAAYGYRPDERIEADRRDGHG